MVDAASDHSTPHGEQALEQLCQSYWRPLYAYVRRQGYARAEAQDLTQDFIVRLLRKEYVGRADESRGKFRTFLLSGLKRFLVNQHEKEHALKRGGKDKPVSFDAMEGESLYQSVLSDDLTPDKQFERLWATSLLERVFKSLRTEYCHIGNQFLFDQLKGKLWGEQDTSYSELAQAVGMNESALKVAAHRLRKRFGEAIRREVADTVASEDEIENEVRALIDAVSGV